MIRQASVADRWPGALKDVPTWKEQGYDAVIEQWRIFIGPKAMTPGQIRDHEDARAFLTALGLAK
jgi:tripartite-type tricarboxylate transporter receptor subunit TctC